MGITREPLTNDRIEYQREIIRGKLDVIAGEVGSKLREAGLNIPVFLTIPRSGNAIVTMATPLDPHEGLWASVAAIVRQVVSERLGSIPLRSRALPCIMATASGTMSAADLAVD